MADLPKTIKISELPEASSVKDTDIFIIEDGTTTHKITGDKLLAYIKNHGDISNYYIQASSVGASNGIAPLNNNKKVPSSNLDFGTTNGTIFDGAKGKALEDSWDAHLLDNDLHHTHSNKSILDSITQAKINKWDSGTGDGSGGGIYSLEDLGVTATAEELNHMDGVTSNVQTQINTLSTTVSGKADASHGTHVTYSTSTPLSDGTGSVGTASTVARSDHRHPSDSTKADTNHTQSASTITEGVFDGQVSTPAGTDYDTGRLRNTALITSDPGTGSDTTYLNGTIICVYE